MKRTCKWFLIAIVLMMLIAIAGCGGSGRDPIDVSGVATISSDDPVNSDGSYFDRYRFRATRDGYVHIFMETYGGTPVSDPYVIVFLGTSEDTIIESDDDSGGGSNAYLSFYAEKGQTYTVKWTTYDADDFGDYWWSVEEVDTSVPFGSPQQVGDNKPEKAPVDPKAKLSRDGN
ncbi:MAG: hypothetical protein Q7N50_15425 [Armatimonadota bacterium]|nr:hypothetical protein [Armatimonadota bacterium]